MLVQHFPTMFHEPPTKWLASIIHNSKKDMKTPRHFDGMWLFVLV